MQVYIQQPKHTHGSMHVPLCPSICPNQGSCKPKVQGRHLLKLFSKSIANLTCTQGFPKQSPPKCSGQLCTRSCLVHQKIMKNQHAAKQHHSTATPPIPLLQSKTYCINMSFPDSTLLSHLALHWLQNCNNCTGQHPTPQQLGALWLQCLTPASFSYVQFSPGLVQGKQRALSR